MIFEYDKSEKIGSYIYFYRGNEIIAVYNPFYGFFVREPSNLKETRKE